MDGIAVTTATEQVAVRMDEGAEPPSPVAVPLETYQRIAANAGVFEPREIEVVSEVLADCQQNPMTSYRLLDERVDGQPVGFVIFGKTPMTDFSWDIYWLVVANDFQGKGYGKRLLKRMEEHLRQSHPKAVLRLETSTKREHTVARGLYLKEGFHEMGRIPHFYGEGDDLIIFYKEIGPEIAHSSKAG